MMTLAAVVLCLAILVPVAMIIIELLSSSSNTDVLVRIVQRPAFRRMLVDTATLLIVCVPAGVGLGLFLALLIGRTDVRIGSIAQALPVVSLLIPPLIGALGWTFLFAPNAGVMNHILDSIGLPTINIYSRPGILAAAAVYLVPYSYTLCSGALASMDSGQEEAARMCGASPLRVLSSVTIPAIKPAVTGSIVIVTMMALAEFSIPLILGSRIGFSVATVQVYRSITGSFPPDYLTASLLGTVLLVGSLLVIAYQRSALSRGSYETISGKAAHVSRLRLGRLRWPAQLFVGFYVCLVVILPLLGILYVALLPYWTVNPTADQFSLDNFRTVLDNPLLLNGLKNSLLLGTVGPLIVIALGLLSGYVITRHKTRLGALVDYTVNLPLGVPQLVLALGFLLAFVKVRSIYGTLWALLIAYVLLFIPHAVRATTSALRQLGGELEEASFMCGASLGTSLRTITVPLVAPTLRGIWILLFVLMFRELSASSLLSTTASPVVSRLMLNIYENGNMTILAAYSMIIFAVNVGILVFVTFRLKAIWSRVRTLVPLKR